MFGYVRAYKPDMTFSQYDIYKGIYCSLCKVIGKNYGLLARMTLSYDFVFFALVRMSVEEDCLGFKKSHCTFNPAKKCMQCNLNNNDLEYTADISMLMVYYKYLDNRDDSSLFKRILLKMVSPYFKRIRRIALKRINDADKILKEMYNLQSYVEKKQLVSLDEACHPSADALGKLLQLNKSVDGLYDFGYLIGRWVYLIDAVDDYDKDKKSGNFNPFLSCDDFCYQKASESLNLTVGQAINVLKKIQVKRFEKIINNILYDGLHSSMKFVIERKNNEKSL